MNILYSDSSVATQEHTICLTHLKNYWEKKRQEVWTEELRKLAPWKWRKLKPTSASHDLLSSDFPGFVLSNLGHKLSNQKPSPLYTKYSDWCHYLIKTQEEATNVWN